MITNLILNLKKSLTLFTFSRSKHPKKGRNMLNILVSENGKDWKAAVLTEYDKE